MYISLFIRLKRKIKRDLERMKFEIRRRPDLQMAYQFPPSAHVLSQPLFPASVW